jgi:glutamate--cysteine ligase catalytic subunit
MRFKPPPPASDIGWRVEFRSMDLQLTDHENAAYSSFIVLLTRAILHFNLNFYIPLSKNDENMKNAQVRDAISSQKFWFRNSVYPDYKPPNADIKSEFKQFTIKEIFCGSEESPGIIHIVERYLDLQDISESTRKILKDQVNLVRDRASGAKITGAKWIRNFVKSHPSYKHDSIITDEINYDLLLKIRDLN